MRTQDSAGDNNQSRLVAWSTLLTRNLRRSPCGLRSGVLHSGITCLLDSPSGSNQRSSDLRHSIQLSSVRSPGGARTRVTTLRGWRADRCTTGPWVAERTSRCFLAGALPLSYRLAASGIRTRNHLIHSEVRSVCASLPFSVVVGGVNKSDLVHRQMLCRLSYPLLFRDCGRTRTDDILFGIEVSRTYASPPWSVPGEPQ